MKIPNPTSVLSVIGILFSGIGLVSPSSASGRAPIPELSLRYQNPAPGSDSLVLTVDVSLPPGWYINSNAPLDSFLVPTSVEVTVAPSEPGGKVAFLFGNPRYPDPVIEHSEAMAGNMSLFRGNFMISIPARAEKAGGVKAARPAAFPPTRVILNYQSCDGRMCWPPKKVSAVLVDGVTRRE
jgi:hypothetical protein